MTKLILSILRTITAYSPYDAGMGHIDKIKNSLDSESFAGLKKEANKDYLKNFEALGGLEEVMDEFKVADRRYM